MPYGYIYISKNNINGMRYVGQHRGEFSPTYLGSGTDMRQALDEFGRENFTVRVVEYADSREELNDKEFDWIRKTDAVISENYYNRSYWSHGGRRAPMTEEHKRKIGLGNKGKVRTAEMKRHQSKVQTGKKHPNRKSSPQTEEHKENIRKANTGRKRGPEACANISEGAKRGWETRRKNIL